MYLFHPFQRQVTTTRWDLDHKLQGKGDASQVPWDNKIIYTESSSVTENAAIKDLAIHYADFYYERFNRGSQSINP